MKINELQNLAVLKIIPNYDENKTYLIHTDGFVDHFDKKFSDITCLKRYSYINSSNKISFVADKHSIFQDLDHKSIYYIGYGDEPLYKYGKYQALLPDPNGIVDISNDSLVSFDSITMKYYDGSGATPSMQVPNLIKTACNRLSSNLGLPFLSDEAHDHTLTIDIRVTHPSDGYKNFEIAKEGYTLERNGDVVKIDAEEVWGVLYALITTLQLCQVNSDSVKIPSKFKIEDNPKYACRALSIDTARNYIKIPTLIRHLKTMEYFKMNVFHWHIVDSTSFPLAFSEGISGYDPSLNAISQAAAYHKTDIYTLKDINHIINFANNRGIEVIIEIDAPGHSNAIGMAYPEYAIWNKFYDEKRLSSDMCGNSSIQPSNYAGAGWNVSTASVAPLSVHYNYYSDNDNFNDISNLIADPSYINNLSKNITDLCSNLSLWNSTMYNIPTDISNITISQFSDMIQIKVNFDVSSDLAFKAYTSFGKTLYNDISNILLTNEIAYSTPGTPEPPSSALNLSKPGLVDLMTKLYKTIIENLDSCYHFHIGGDEDTIIYTSAFNIKDLINYLQHIVNSITSTKSKNNQNPPKIMLWQELLFSTVTTKPGESRERLTYIYTQIFKPEIENIPIIIHNWASIFGIDDQRVNYQRLKLTKDISNISWIQSPGSQYYLDSGRDLLYGRGKAWNGYNVTWQSLLLYEPNSYTLNPSDMYNIKRTGIDLCGNVVSIETKWDNSGNYMNTLDASTNSIFVFNSYSNKVFDGTDEPTLQHDFSTNKTFTDPSLTTQILGGSLLVWTETFNDTNIDSGIWPKAIGGAINLWGTSEECTLKDHIPILPISANQINSDWVNGFGGLGEPTIIPFHKRASKTSISYKLAEKLPENLPYLNLRILLNYSILSRLYAVNDTIQQLYNIKSEPIYSFYGYNPPYQKSSLAQLKTTCYPAGGIVPDLVSRNICNMPITVDGSFSLSGEWRQNILPSIS